MHLDVIFVITNIDIYDEYFYCKKCKTKNKDIV